MKAFPFAVILLVLAASVALAGCSGPAPAPVTPANSAQTTGNAGMKTIAPQATTPVTTTPAGTTGARYADLPGFVDAAVAYAKANGKDAALKEFNNVNGTFIQGDLYICLLYTSPSPRD